jgi:hypothetical protein
MRHLLSLLLAIVLTPLLYLATGYGLLKFAAAVQQNGDWKQILLAALAVVIAGASYAALIMPRISPLGPVLAGLALLGVAVWALADAASFADVVPEKLFGVHGLLYAPVNATTAVIALPLLFTIASPRRWRRFANPADAAGPASAAPDYPTPDPTPTYSPSYSPSYTPPASSYSPYPSVSSTSSGGLGGSDTKVDDQGADDTVAQPGVSPPDSTTPSSPFSTPSSPYGTPSSPFSTPSSPYATPPVPTQPSSPENWPPRP